MSDQRSAELKEAERKDKLESLRRYEATRREQLGAAINLVFGLAAAAAGFCVSQITAEHAHFSGLGTFVFLSATFLFILTVGLCMLTTWTRLQDYRATSDTLRAELRDAPAAEVARFRAGADRLGIRTWVLFRAQSLAFVLGVVLLAISLWKLYSARLFPA
jgi:hypothetical protein